MTSKRASRAHAATWGNTSRKRRPWVALGIAAVWAWLPTAALPGQELEDWSIERGRRELAFDGSRRVVVSGRHGDVRVRPGEPGVVELSWVAQRHPKDGFAATVEVRREEALFVTPGFVDAGGAPVSKLPTVPRRRIDLVVYVPAETEVEIRGDRDLAEVKGLEAPVVATTDGGDIAIVTTGPVTARTERGEIEATLVRLSWEGASRFESLTGSVTVRLPPEPDVVVRGETFGELTTDFSVEIERRPPSVKKHFVMTLGDPARRLTVTSNRGGIRILRSPS